MLDDEMTELRQKVHEVYSAAAESPEDKHPFPVGHKFAESLGYAPDLLDELKSAGFRDAEVLRTTRNARTINKKALAADVVAYR
jgi:hypothetical protein